MGMSDSEYIKILKSDNPKQLVIAFSAAADKGRFNYYRQFSHRNESVILLNAPDEYYYHFGVPGLGNNLEDTVECIKQAIAQIMDDDAYITTIGCSMGGYGALLYGAMLGVDKVVGFSPSCPKFTVREEIAKNRPLHVEQYNRVKSKIFEFQGEKQLIYGDLSPQDHASFFEFQYLHNTSSLMIENMPHQVVEPLIHIYGLDALLYADDLTYLESGFDISDMKRFPYAEAFSKILYAPNFRRHDMEVLANQYAEKILESNCYISLFAFHLVRSGSETAEAGRFFDAAFDAERPVNLFALRLMRNNLHRFDEQLVCDYCLRAIDYLSDKCHTAEPHRVQIRKALGDIVSIMVDQGRLKALQLCYEKFHGIVPVALLNEIKKYNFFIKLGEKYHVDIAMLAKEFGQGLEMVSNAGPAFAMFKLADFLGSKEDIVQKKLQAYKKSGVADTGMLYGRLKVVKIENAFIELAFLDEQNNGMPLYHNTSFSLNGVVLLKQEVADKDSCELVIEQKGNIYKANWNIASPMVAGKFSNNSNAAYARFQFSNLLLNDECAIYLRRGDGSLEELFKLAIGGRS